MGGWLGTGYRQQQQRGCPLLKADHVPDHVVELATGQLGPFGKQATEAGRVPFHSLAPTKTQGQRNVGVLIGDAEFVKPSHHVGVVGEHDTMNPMSTSVLTLVVGPT